MTKQYLRELHPSIPHIDLQQQQQRMLRILKDITSLDFPLIRWPRLKACTRGVVLNNHSSYSIHWLQSCKWERRGESGTKDSGRTKLQSTARRLTVWYVRICGTWDSENPGFWIPCGICKISYVEELIPVVLCSRKFKRAILNFQKSLCISFVQFPFYRESYLFFFISVIKGIFRKKIKGK